MSAASRRRVVVLAVKALDDAKSRLDPLPAVVRPGLVAAMLADTLDAVTAAVDSPVVVVSPDPAVHAIAAEFGARGVAEPSTVPPGWTSLNAALHHGAQTVDADVAVYVQADLPTLRPESLRQALDEAVAPAFVADRAGTGTALLVADRSFVPRFGVGSAAAHRAAGATELDPDRARWPDLRADVDTLADLAAARAVGLGMRTARQAFTDAAQ